jgi:hypothetical protein
MKTIGKITELKALELIIKEFPQKYPEGSTVCLTRHHEFDIEVYSCLWHDRKGVGFPLQNIEPAPPQYKYLTHTETMSLINQYDEVVWVPGISIVGAPKKELNTSGPELKKYINAFKACLQNNSSDEAESLLDDLRAANPENYVLLMAFLAQELLSDLPKT